MYFIFKVTNITHGALLFNRHLSVFYGMSNDLQSRAEQSAKLVQWSFTLKSEQMHKHLSCKLCTVAFTIHIRKICIKKTMWKPLLITIKTLNKIKT